MPRTRTIIPHCKLNQPIIDAFQCSECEWSFVMPGAKPYVIAPQDAESACGSFDRHQCEHFKPRKAKEQRDGSATEQGRELQSKVGKATAAKRRKKGAK